jgi:hypothetical protein
MAAISKKEFRLIKEVVRKWIAVAINASTNQANPHKVSIDSAQVGIAKIPANVFPNGFLPTLG